MTTLLTVWFEDIPNYHHSGDLDVILQTDFLITESKRQVGKFTKIGDFWLQTVIVDPL